MAFSLAGCAVSTDGASPDPVETPNPAATAATCPDGLAAALEAHLAGQPFAGALPLETHVVEFPPMTFSSAVVADLSGCVFTTELVLAGGETMSQIYGITDGHDEDDVIAAVRAAGWEQTFPAVEPGVWQDPSHPDEGVSLYPQGVAEQPALGFADWARYLGPDDVLLLGSIRM